MIEHPSTPHQSHVVAEESKPKTCVPILPPTHKGAAARAFLSYVAAKYLPPRSNKHSISPQINVMIALDRSKSTYSVIDLGPAFVQSAPPER